MFILTRFKLNFLALLLIVFFIRLGMWQLERAHEKQQMLVAAESLAHSTPIFWKPGDALPSQYQPIKVAGKFLPTNFLLDNQHYKHQLGFNVLSSLELPNGDIVIIDRGWIPNGITAGTPNGLLSLHGQVYYPSNKQWVLGPIYETKTSNLIVLEKIDIPTITKLLNKTVLPFIIRLDSKAKYGYIREWPIVAMTPERHYGYAVQWFALAGLVVIICIVLNFKKR